MTGKYAKISSVALTLLLLTGCEVFSEKKLNAYVGDSSQEYTRSYYNYAYNTPENEQQGHTAAEGAEQGNFAPRPVAYYAPAAPRSAANAGW